MKLRKLLLIFLATWLLVLPYAGNFQIPKARAAFPLVPQSDDEHTLVADPNGGKTITDTYSRRTDASVSGKQGLTYWWIAPESAVTNPNPFISSEVLFAFDGITKEGSETTELYLGINQNTLKWSGVYKFNRTSTKLTNVYSGGVSEGDQAVFGAGNTGLSDPAKNYLKSLIRLQLMGGMGYGAIENMTPSTLGTPTSTSLNCPGFGLSSINYGDISDMLGKFKGGDAGDISKRVNPAAGAAPQAAAGTHIKVYYQPNGSPTWAAEPIFDEPMGADGKVNLSDDGLNNLQKGKYFVTAQWAVKNVSNAAGQTALWDLDPMEGTSDWSYFWAVADAVATMDLVSREFWKGGFYDSVKYKVMGARSSFTVGDNADTNTQAVACGKIVLNATRWAERDTPTTDTGGCGAIIPNAIIQWAFCQMLYSLKALATWASCKANGLFLEMNNLGSLQNSDGTPKKVCPTAADSGGTGSTASPSTPTPVTTPTGGGDTSGGGGTSDGLRHFTKTVHLDSHYSTFHDAPVVLTSFTASITPTGSNSYTGTATFSEWNSTNLTAKVDLVSNVPITLLVNSYSASVVYQGDVFVYTNP